MGDDGSGERGDGLGQTPDSEPVEMTYCRRVGFVGLTGTTSVVSGYGVAMPANGTREGAARTLRDDGDRNKGDTRD